MPWGAILRDSARSFIVAACIYKQRGLDVASMEDEAVLVVLQLAKTTGIHYLVVESDSLEIA